VFTEKAFYIFSKNNRTIPSILQNLIKEGNAHSKLKPLYICEDFFVPQGGVRKFADARKS
jgi:hypothetical protein